MEELQPHNNISISGVNFKLQCDGDIANLIAEEELSDEKVREVLDKLVMSIAMQKTKDWEEENRTNFINMWRESLNDSLEDIVKGEMHAFSELRFYLDRKDDGTRIGLNDNVTGYYRNDGDDSMEGFIRDAVQLNVAD